MTTAMMNEMEKKTFEPFELDCGEYKEQNNTSLRREGQQRHFYATYCLVVVLSSSGLNLLLLSLLWSLRRDAVDWSSQASPQRQPHHYDGKSTPTPLPTWNEEDQPYKNFCRMDIPHEKEESKPYTEPPLGDCRSWACRYFIDSLKESCGDDLDPNNWRFSPVILTGMNDCHVSFDVSETFSFGFPSYLDFEDCWLPNKLSYSLFWNHKPCPLSSHKDDRVIDIGPFQGRLQAPVSHSGANVVVTFADNFVLNTTTTTTTPNTDLPNQGKQVSFKSSCWTFYCTYPGESGDSWIAEQSRCIEIAQRHIQLVSKYQFLDAVKQMDCGD